MASVASIQQGLTSEHRIPSFKL